VGCVTVVVPVKWKVGLRYVFLMTSTHGRFLGLGHRTGDEKFDGEVLWVGCEWYLFWEDGEGEEETPGHVQYVFFFFG
jgi:hypothetical protein